MTKKILSCDWGTSSFRMRVVDTATRTVLEEVSDQQGIATTHRQWLASTRPASERAAWYRTVLSHAAQKMKTILEEGTPMILSGMASSSVGIQELSYGRFPFTWNPSMLTVEKFDPNALLAYPLFLVSGLRTETDVMRGEETMLLGYDVSPVGNQVLIFPGTHSKHVWVNNGVATHFKTFTTGEIFNLLVQHSILSNSVEQGDDWESFEGGVNAAREDDFLHGIFKVRTRQLLQGAPRSSNYQYLSGLLIGLELKGLQGCADSIAVISEEPLTSLYVRALRIFGLQNQTITVRAQDTLINGHIKMATTL